MLLIIQMWFILCCCWTELRLKLSHNIISISYSKEIWSFGNCFLESSFSHWKQKEKEMWMYAKMRSECIFCNSPQVILGTQIVWTTCSFTIYYYYVFPYASHNCQHLGAVSKIWNRSLFEYTCKKSQNI